MTDLSRYMGRELYLDDLSEVVRRAYRVSVEGSIAFYGDTVDAQMIDDQVRLCDETADYIYSDYTPLEVTYQRGSRPELEHIIDRILDGVTDAQERALTIMRFVRDIHKLRPEGDRGAAGDLFHGGTEEEVIKKGSNMCNEQARVFCVLCQVAGMPARYVGHYIDRHGVSEVYCDGRWAYIDNEGRYFLKEDGTLASTWELKQHPQLVTSQRPEVIAEARKRFSLERSEREFCPVEVTVITNYVAWEHARFNYDWIWPTEAFHERIRPRLDGFPKEVGHDAVIAMIRGERPWPD